MSEPTAASSAAFPMEHGMERATESDAPAIAALRADVADALTARFGAGHWSTTSTVRGVLALLRGSSMYVARRDGEIVACLRLATKKPWAIDRSYFTPCARPIHLTDMAVAPAVQGRGIGARCLDQARRIVAEWPADAIRLDAYDAPAGAGDFYRKCGFRETGRVVYRGVPLVYFETPIVAASPITAGPR